MSIPIRRYLELLRAYLRPQQARVLVLAVLLLASIGLQLLNPQILRQFIDAATAGTAPAALTWLALAFIAVAFMGQALAVALTYISQNVAWTATNALRADLAAHCLQLGLSFHKARTPGELIERVDGDVNQLSTFFSEFAVNLLGNALLLLGILVMLFSENVLVGAGLSLFALLALGILLRIRNLATPYWNRVREHSAQFYGFVGEQLAGTEDVRSSGATGYVLHRFYTLLRAWLPVTRIANLAGYTMWTTSLGMFVIGNAVAFSLSAYLWQRGGITIGTVYLIFYYTELLRQPIEQLRTQLQDLQKADASIARVTELFATQPTLRSGSRTLPTGPLAVEVKSLSFAYADAIAPASERNDQANVLTNISFALAPGTVLGLLGRTGSGKTTLARLLLRLYDPNQGEILLGGVPLTEASTGDLRRRVGVVTQDVQLFNASVRDNLTFFDSTISDERIVTVLDDLGMAAWLRSLPASLDSELEGGGALSAGEAQLLAFARLFLIDPGLVILDEASSRLDPATEALIEQAVSKLLANRTGIIIAHRLATVQRADHILTLEQGQILEYGQRTHLRDDPTSRFAALLRAGAGEVLA